MFHPIGMANVQGGPYIFPWRATHSLSKVLKCAFNLYDGFFYPVFIMSFGVFTKLRHFFLNNNKIMLFTRVVHCTFQENTTQEKKNKRRQGTNQVTKNTAFYFIFQVIKVIFIFISILPILSILFWEILLIVHNIVITMITHDDDVTYGENPKLGNYIWTQAVKAERPGKKQQHQHQPTTKAYKRYFLGEER